MERITLVDNNRQVGMLQALKFKPDEQHIIIGCGGIGFWLGILLTMLGAQDIVIMDGDRIDASNLSRLPVPQTWIGTNKAVALRKTLRSLRPDLRVVCFTTHITVDTLSLLEQFTLKREKTHTQSYYNRSGDIGTTVWDTTDDANIQSKINAYVKTLEDKQHEGRYYGSREEVNRIFYRKIGYEGFNVGSYNEFEVWTQGDYTTGYRTTSANAVSSVMAAGFGVFARYLVPKHDVQLNLSNIITEEVARCTLLKAKMKTDALRRRQELAKAKRDEAKKKLATPSSVSKEKKKPSKKTSGIRVPRGSLPKTVRSVATTARV